MASKKSVGARTVSILFPTWSPFRRTMTLFKADLDSRVKSWVGIKDVYSAAWEKLVSEEHDVSAAPATFAEARERSGVSLATVYHHYLRQKRISLVCAVFFVCMNCVALLRGHWWSLLYMLVTVGLCLEIAWTSEFRLWQCRTQRLSNEAGGSLRDFLNLSRAWVGAFNAEPGYGLSGPQRVYKRWVWLKRIGLSGSVLALGVATLRLGVGGGWPPVYALSAAGALLGMSLLTEARLRLLRVGEGYTKRRFGWASFELGVFRVTGGNKS